MGRRLDKDGPEFRRLAVELCAMYCHVYQCKECSYPVVENHDCRWCGCRQPVVDYDDNVDLFL